MATLCRTALACALAITATAATCPAGAQGSCSSPDHLLLQAHTALSQATLALNAVRGCNGCTGCLWSNNVCYRDAKRDYCLLWRDNAWCDGAGMTTVKPTTMVPTTTAATTTTITPTTTTIAAPTTVTAATTTTVQKTTTTSMITTESTTMTTTTTTTEPTTTTTTTTTLAPVTTTGAAPSTITIPTTAVPVTTRAPTECSSCSDECCSSCVAVPGNFQSARNAHCAPCSGPNPQTWWPCNIDGLCKCAGAADPPVIVSTTKQEASTTTTRSPDTTTAEPQTTTAKLQATTTGGGGGDSDTCSARGPECTFTPGEGISSWFTKEIFDEMFPHICNPACRGCEMLKYECLIKATLLYPTFANSGDRDTDMRELAAWLGQMSQETTGGGCGASIENADGTCSCGGSNWCDNEPNGGCSRWGLCFVEEAGGEYCDRGVVNQQYYPCTPGKEYRGRGPKQLSWNYNYGQFSREFCGDSAILLNDPDRVATNPTLAWASSIWFWMTGGACIREAGEVCKPGCQEVFLGTKAMCTSDVAADRRYGLGWVTNVVNGGLECGGAGNGKCDYRVHSRVRFYKRYCEILGVDPLAPGWTEDANLFCEDQKNYATVAPTNC